MAANNSTVGNASGPSESVMTAVRIFIAFLYVFLIIIPIGNGIVIYFVCTRKRLHTITNWMVVSLAVSDLAVGLAIIPSRIACLYYKCDEHLLKILYDLFVFASLCNICILTVDRFIAIMYPLKYCTIMTIKMAVKLITASWLVPIVLLSIRMVWQYGYPHDVQLQRQADKIFYVTQILLFMFIPCLIMLIAYSLIFREALNQSYRIHNLQQSLRHGSRRQRRGSNDAKHALKVFGLVFLIFLFCWILSAYRTILLQFYNEHGAIDDPIVILSRLLLLFNSGVNPLIYSLWKKDLRTELKKSCGCDRRRYYSGTTAHRGNKSVQKVARSDPMNELSSSSDSGKKTQDTNAITNASSGAPLVPEENCEQDSSERKPA